MEKQHQFFISNQLRKKALFAAFLMLPFFHIAQVSESCNCDVDTAGYANFLPTLSPNENATFQFHVNNTFAVAYGVIGSTTPAVVQDLITNHPTVTTIVMYACPGSEDDVANLQASQLIHDHGYKMYLPVDGWVASGATDMFVAGSVRVIDAWFDPVGVHSWSDGVNEATDYPVGHAFHQPYIDYYMYCGFTQQEAEDFYYFTIYAAPAAGIYWMTDAEMDQYKIRTCKYSANPTYSVSQSGLTITADLSGATTYQWLDCDNGNAPIPGATNQTFTPVQDGNYAVEIVESGCSGVSECFAFQTASLTDIPKDHIPVYPNPSSDYLVINGGELVTSLEIFNELGQRQEYQIEGGKLKIAQLPSGIYCIRWNDGTRVHEERFVKK